MERGLFARKNQEIAEPITGRGPTVPMQAPAGLTELDQLLMVHARQSTSLAATAGEIKANWLAFAMQAEAAHVPEALRLVTQLGRIRGELVDETIRIAEILHGSGRSKTTFNVGEAAVLVVPSVRRRGQAE